MNVLTVCPSCGVPTPLSYASIEVCEFCHHMGRTAANPVRPAPAPPRYLKKRSPAQVTAEHALKAFKLGTRISQLGLGIDWLYQPHEKLNGLSPKEACDAGRMDEVEQLVNHLATQTIN